MVFLNYVCMTSRYINICNVLYLHIYSESLKRGNGQIIYAFNVQLVKNLIVYNSVSDNLTFFTERNSKNKCNLLGNCR